MKNQRGSATFWLLISIALALVIVSFYMYLVIGSKTLITAPIKSVVTSDMMASLATYTNPVYGYTFEYDPIGMTVYEHGNTTDIDFLDGTATSAGDYIEAFKRDPQTSFADAVTDIISPSGKLPADCNLKVGGDPSSYPLIFGDVEYDIHRDDPSNPCLQYADAGNPKFFVEDVNHQNVFYFVSTGSAFGGVPHTVPWFETFMATSTARATASIPSGWHMYTNSAYGYTFQYPSTWTSNGDIPITSTSSDISLMYATGTAGNPIDDIFWVNTASGSCNPGSKISSASVVNINGAAFETWNADDTATAQRLSSTKYCIVKNGIAYTLQTGIEYGLDAPTSDGFDPTIDENKDVTLNQILSSFNFINQTNAIFPVATTTSAISVSGMSQYINHAFGFSFWYPSTWTVKDVAVQNPGVFPGGTVEKILQVDNGSYQGVEISEFHSNGMSISYPASDCPADLYGCPRQTIYFDPNLHTWMDQIVQMTSNGFATSTTAADVSINTMGGLHLTHNLDRFDMTGIIPLSAENFLVVSSLETGQAITVNPIAGTILATDPSVATPVSQVEQIQTIQAEAAAYSNQ